jgi:hypothetical protein
MIGELATTETSSFSSFSISPYLPSLKSWLLWLYYLIISSSCQAISSMREEFGRSLMIDGVASTFSSIEHFYSSAL